MSELIKFALYVLQYDLSLDRKYIIPVVDTTKESEEDIINYSTLWNRHLIVAYPKNDFNYANPII